MSSMKWRIATIKISSNFEKTFKICAKKSRRASQPIGQFFGSGKNNVENDPKKNAIDARTRSTGEVNALKDLVLCQIL